MKIDVAAHITPPKYLKTLEKKIVSEVLSHLPKPNLKPLGLD